MTSSLVVIIVIIGCSFASASALSTGDKNHIVDIHNNARMAEPASNMIMLHWDDILGINAQQWTDKCHFSHQSGKFWGENIAARTNHHNKTLDIENMFGQWMAEQKHNTGGTFEECCSQAKQTCCHLTQVLWGQTSQIGCGFTECATLTTNRGHAMNNVVYMACYYNPPGNKPVSHCTWDWRPYIPNN